MNDVAFIFAFGTLGLVLIVLIIGAAVIIKRDGLKKAMDDLNKANKEEQWNYNLSVRTKKYYCPICSHKMSVKRKTETFKANSQELKDLGFGADPEIGGFNSDHDVKVHYDVFYCEECKETFEKVCYK